MRRRKVELVLMMVLCLIAGCKTTYNNDSRPLPGGLKFAKGETNDLSINLHITNEPLDKVVLKVEPTNSTPEIEMKVRLTAKEPEETTLPLIMDVKATNKSPVPVSMTVSNTSAVVVPINLFTDAVKEIIVPIKVRLDTSDFASAKISSEITLKLDDDVKALVKQLADCSLDAPPKMNLTGWGHNLSWLCDFLVLLFIVAVSGAAGGFFRTVADDASRHLIYTKISVFRIWKSAELLSNIIFGITAAFLVPTALYLKHRKFFELGVKDPLFLLILVSASFAAGLIGAVFVQWFYTIATKMFHENEPPK